MSEEVLKPWTGAKPVIEQAEVKTVIEREVVRFELDDLKVEQAVIDRVRSFMSEGERERWPEIAVRLRCDNYGDGPIYADVELIGKPQ